MIQTIISFGILAIATGLFMASVRSYNKARRLYASVRKGQEDYYTLKKDVEVQRVELTRKRKDIAPLYSTPDDYVIHMKQSEYPVSCIQVHAVYQDSRIMPVIKEFKFKWHGSDEHDFAMLQATELIEKLKE